MKITKIFALIFFAAAQIFAQESSEDSFNDIDFVPEENTAAKKRIYIFMDCILFVRCSITGKRNYESWTLIRLFC